MSCLPCHAGHFNMTFTIRQIQETGTSDGITNLSSMIPQINQTGYHYPSAWYHLIFMGR